MIFTNSSCLNGFDHTIKEVWRRHEHLERMTTLLESNVRLGRSDLRVNILGHEREAQFVVYWVNQADWYSINFT